MYGYGYQYSAIISGGGNPAAAIFGTYKTRVLADGGVVENDACTIAFLESIGAGTDIIPSFSFLLDDYSGAAAAYSLRQLSSSYSGDAIRVRRASDNAELNIGFVANELDTAALTSFASGTNAFVTTWYDQSGNGLNFTQTTALLQSQIVASGSIISFSGKPAIKNNNTGYFINTTTLTLSTYSIFIAGEYDGGAIASRRLLSFGNNFMLAVSGSTVVQFSQRSGVGSNPINGGTVALNTDYLQTFIKDATYFRNGADVSAEGLISGFGLNNAQMSLFSTTTGGNVISFLGAELIVYGTDETTNRSGIETNINTYYGIY